MVNEIKVEDEAVTATAAVVAHTGTDPNSGPESSDAKAQPAPTNRRADRDKKPKRPPMRSTFACMRCRNSKIKCDNNGRTEPCTTCIKTGKECIYPDNMAVVGQKRPEPVEGIRTEQSWSERKRLKRLEGAASEMDKYSPELHAESVLSADYLTESLWSKIFAIFKRNFTTELPFLHMATLKEKMGRKFRPRETGALSQEIRDNTNLVLLGILTLTGRLCPELSAYVAGLAKNSAKARLKDGNSELQTSDASAYYADVLTKALLGRLAEGLRKPTVERVQALLMLGLYEWSHVVPKTGGVIAWMYIGMAIRMAQALALEFGDRHDPIKKYVPRSQTASRFGDPQRNTGDVISKEVGRRTMFSCFTLDRLLACGEERVTFIRSEDLHIRLPMTDMGFNHGEDEQTNFLWQLEPKSGGRSEPENPGKEGLLCLFIRLVDIWGEISKYSFDGGRFSDVTDDQETIAPWDRRSSFYRLDRRLSDFYSRLPGIYQWSSRNYDVHADRLESGTYVSLHMLGAVCQIMLHREYIPFIPSWCPCPVGPIDFAKTKDKMELRNPPDTGWWERSAENVFKFAHVIVEAIETSGENLPMSALILFSIYTASFVGVYACHFPRMDRKGYMLPAECAPSTDRELITTVGPSGITFQCLTRMSRWLGMATSYVSYFHYMNDFYRMVRWRSPPADGLDNWRKVRPKITNNGSLLAEGEKSDDDDGQSLAGIGLAPSDSTEDLATSSTERSEATGLFPQAVGLLADNAAGSGMPSTQYGYADGNTVPHGPLAPHLHIANVDGGWENSLMPSFMFPALPREAARDEVFTRTFGRGFRDGDARAGPSDPALAFDNIPWTLAPGPLTLSMGAVSSDADGDPGTQPWTMDGGGHATWP